MLKLQARVTKFILRFYSNVWAFNISIIRKFGFYWALELSYPMRCALCYLIIYYGLVVMFATHITMLDSINLNRSYHPYVIEN